MFLHKHTQVNTLKKIYKAVITTSQGTLSLLWPTVSLNSTSRTPTRSPNNSRDSTNTWSPTFREHSWTAGKNLSMFSTIDSLGDGSARQKQEGNEHKLMRVIFAQFLMTRSRVKHNRTDTPTPFSSCKAKTEPGRVTRRLPHKNWRRGKATSRDETDVWPSSVTAHNVLLIERELETERERKRKNSQMTWFRSTYSQTRSEDTWFQRHSSILRLPHVSCDPSEAVQNDHPCAQCSSTSTVNSVDVGSASVLQVQWRNHGWSACVYRRQPMWTLQCLFLLDSSTLAAKSASRSEKKAVLSQRARGMTSIAGSHLLLRMGTCVYRDLTVTVFAWFGIHARELIRQRLTQS